MRLSRKFRMSTFVATAALSAAVAAPAQAAPTTQQGLVNVNVSDVIVQVPIAVAANICDTTVNVLATAPEAGNTVCTAEAGPDNVVAYGGPDGPTRQEGLVNVNIDGLIVQLPISVAANVCDTTVNVLALAPVIENTQCTADAGDGDVIAVGRRGRA